MTFNTASPLILLNPLEPPITTSLLTKRKRSSHHNDLPENNNLLLPEQPDLSNGKKRKILNYQNAPQQHLGIFPCSDDIYILSPLKRKRVFVDPDGKRRRNGFLMDVNYFEILPSELIKFIFSLLNFDDFGCIYLVSWIWHNYAEDEGLWLCRYKNIWHTNPERSLYIKINPVGWKKLTLSRRNVELQYFFSGVHHHPPFSSYIYMTWGDFLCSEASKLLNSDVETARLLFFVALQEYHSASTRDPESYEILIRWGDALSDYALTCSGKEREILFVMSKDKFEIAKTLMPIKNETKLGSVDISYFGLDNNVNEDMVLEE